MNPFEKVFFQAMTALIVTLIVIVVLAIAGVLR